MCLEFGAVVRVLIASFKMSASPIVAFLLSLLIVLQMGECVWLRTMRSRHRRVCTTGLSDSHEDEPKRGLRIGRHAGGHGMFVAHTGE